MDHLKMPTITGWPRNVQENWVPYWLTNSPNVLLAIAVATVLYCAYMLWRGRRLKKRQGQNDQLLMKLVDAKETSASDFIHQLFFLGIFTPGEELALTGKYGPGVASNYCLAAIVARLIRENSTQSADLAEQIVAHFFATGKNFVERRALTETFRDQVMSQFPTSDFQEVVWAWNFGKLVSLELASKEVEERAEQEVLAADKEERRARKLARQDQKRWEILYLSFGAVKTTREVWLAVGIQLCKNLARKSKQISIPAPADTLP